jgi:hypothetical protein
MKGHAIADDIDLQLLSAMKIKRRRMESGKITCPASSKMAVVLMPRGSYPAGWFSTVKLVR